MTGATSSLERERKKDDMPMASADAMSNPYTFNVSRIGIRKARTHFLGHLYQQAPNPYAPNPYASAGMPFGGATPFGVSTN